MELKSYKISLDGEHWTTINHTSKGKAKSEFYHSYDMDFEFTDIRVRANGRLFTPDAFKHTAKSRGVGFAYCGMAVEVDGDRGWLVGRNDSANFNVLFFEGKWKGQTLNCHPNWKMRYLTWRGKITVIKTFCISKLSFAIASLPTPNNFVTEMSSLFFNYIWNGKTSRIKNNVLYNDYADGGLR